MSKFSLVVPLFGVFILLGMAGGFLTCQVLAIQPKLHEWYVRCNIISPLEFEYWYSRFQSAVSLISYMHSRKWYTSTPVTLNWDPLNSQFFKFIYFGIFNHGSKLISNAYGQIECDQFIWWWGSWVNATTYSVKWIIRNCTHSAFRPLRNLLFRLYGSLYNYNYYS